MKATSDATRQDLSSTQKLEDLQVWDRACNLAECVCRVRLSKAPEQFHPLENQMHRSAISVPSNIAEGWGRGSVDDFRRHLDTALVSLAELSTQLLLAGRLSLLGDTEVALLRDECDQLRRMILAFRRALLDPTRGPKIQEEATEYEAGEPKP